MQGPLPVGGRPGGEADRRDVGARVPAGGPAVKSGPSQQTHRPRTELVRGLRHAVGCGAVSRHSDPDSYSNRGNPCADAPHCSPCPRSCSPPPAAARTPRRAIQRPPAPPRPRRRRARPRAPRPARPPAPRS
ncbi:hypothetical protein SCOCK_550041 [Actinacidiphila cocklensis]|uniref:Uncharacterized protein n=1 Tax=Actinacidiphila cocklensis TaxID=887465 RepID=A0A9W4E1Q4_9ACTN|nr:hypothetical protein SCOCK_550041 [Actinacidiphila cocklensis]